MKKTTAKKCICGGTLKWYARDGFLPKAIKCNRCGVGESFGEKDTNKSIKETIRLIQKGEW